MTTSSPVRSPHAAPPVVIAVGGVDPSGGSGTGRDVQAIAACGAFPIAVPTAMAVQTGSSFRASVPLSARLIAEMLECAAASHRISAVKVGMVGSAEAARVLGLFLSTLAPGTPVVVDPVLSSTSGGVLLPPSALPPFRKMLLLATVTTPNLPEAEALLGRTLRTPAEAEAGAVALRGRTGGAVLLKGGHFPWRGWKGTDLLVTAGGETLRIPPPPGERRGDARGTGCALASALAARLAMGDDVAAAAVTAKALVARWIGSAFPGLDGRRYLGAE